MKKLLILFLLITSICGYVTVAGACGFYNQPYRPHRHYVAPPPPRRYYYRPRRRYVAPPPYRRYYYRPHRRYFGRHYRGNQVRIRVGNENASVRMRLNL